MGVLHLMKAPRHKVMTKLLAAHQHRSVRMIAEFNDKCQQAAANIKSKTDASSILSVESLQDLATARQFHQNVLVGLIEACKGIFELYDPNQSNRGGGSATPAGSATTTQQHEHEIVSPKDIAQAYELLRQMISSVMKDYTKSFSTAFHLFFESFQVYFHQDPMEFSTLLENKDLELLEELKKQISLAAKETSLNESNIALENTVASSSGAAGSSSTSSSSEFHSTNVLELYEERTSWLMLARQAILDVMYLDSTLRETASRQLGIVFKDDVGASTTTSNATTTAVKVNVAVPNYGNVFSDAILQEVHKHNTIMRKIFVKHFVQHIEQYWFPKIALLTHGTDRLVYFHHHHVQQSTQSLQQGESQNSSHSSHGTTVSTTPMNGRNIMQQHTQIMSNFFEILKSQCLETFHECLRFYKPVLDIYEAIGREHSKFLLLCAELTSAFVTDLLHAITAGASSCVSSCQLKIHFAEDSSSGDGTASGGGGRSLFAHRRSSSRASSSLRNKSNDAGDIHDNDDDDDDEHDPSIDEIFDGEAFEKVADVDRSSKFPTVCRQIIYPTDCLFPFIRKSQRCCSIVFSCTS